MRYALVMMVVFGCMTTGCATKTVSQSTEEEALRLAQLEDRNRPQRIVIQATRTQQQPTRPAVSKTTRPSGSPASTSAASPDRPSSGTPISQAGATGAAAPSGQANSTPASSASESASQGSQSSCSSSQTSSSGSGGSPGNDPSQSGAGNAALSAVTPPPSKGGASSAAASSSAPAGSPSFSGSSGQQSPTANDVAGVAGPTGADGQSGAAADSGGDDTSTSNQRQSSKAGHDDGSPVWLVSPEKVDSAANQSPLGQPTPDTSGVVETADTAGDGGGQGGQASGSSASDSQGGAGGETESDESGGGSGSQSNDGTKAEPAQPSASGVSSPDQEQTDGDGVRSDRLPLTLSSLASSAQQSPNSNPLDIDDAALSDTRNTTGGMLDERPDHRDALRGVWRLVHIDGDARRDFLPTGADERFIGLDPDNEEIAVILSWGHGDVVLMADYEMQASPSQMVIRASGNHASRLPGRDTVIPGGGRLIGPSSEAPWTLDWSRHGSSLRIGGCLYSAADPDTLDALLRGKGRFASHSSELATTVKSVGAPSIPEKRSTVDFFGVQSEGRWVCYIVDVSGSMSGGKLKRLKGELQKSISALDSDVSFSIVFFSSGASVLANDWTQAKSREASHLLAQMRSISANGGTDPGDAFQWAFGSLDPSPDVFFLMTDGQVATPDLSGMLRRLNSRKPRARIHTIGFGGEADIGLLRQIANEHGGTHVHVQ